MKNATILGKSKPIGRLVAFAGSIILSFTLMARDYYATPNGAGDRDGSDWENAISGADIEDFIHTVMRGGDRLLLDDNDTSFDNIQITISSGGANFSLPILIEGVDLGDGFPLFKGTDRSTGVFIYLNSSVSYVTIKNLRIEDYKYAIESEEDIADPNENIIFDGLDIQNVTDGLYLRDFRNSTIRNCEITYHTKRGIRLRTGCRNLEIIDCYTDHNMGNYGSFPSNQFPVGFEVGEGRHDSDTLDQTNITFIRCEARNCVDDDQSYWNGDGFLVNDKHFDIRFYDCIAYGNADGGWDDKGIGTYYKNCISVGNGRNFRNWHSGTYTNCLAVNPSKYADDASGGHDNWWFDGNYGDAVVDLFNCTSHNGSISSSGNFVKINYAENCIFSDSDEGGRIASGIANVFTDGADPDYTAPSTDYEGHPGDAYNSQKYGPEKGYWYSEGVYPVIDEMKATPFSGDTPLDVQFEAHANDPDGDDASLQYYWYLKGRVISESKDFTHRFNIPGDYTIVLTVRDITFLESSDTIPVKVTGNYPPEVEFTSPLNKQFFFVGQPVSIKVDAADRDGEVDSLQFFLNDNYLGTDESVPYEYVLSGLAEGAYTLKARAFDDDRVFVDDSVKIESTVPLTLYELSWDGSVELYWEDHLNSVPNDFGDLAGYNVYRSQQSGGEYIKINPSLIDTARFADATVDNGTEIYYVVTAENATGNETGFSNEVVAIPQVSLHLDCSDDAQVRDGKYEEENYGSDPGLMVKNATEDWQRYSYLKFDLSPIGSFSRAALRIKSTDVGAEFHSVRCYLADDDSWTEEKITWKNKPDTASLIDATKVRGHHSWVEFDLTNEVKAEHAGDGYISLVLLKEEFGNPGYIFHSKEATDESDHPRLYITPEDVTSFHISANAGEGGSIVPQGEISVFTGFHQSFHIEADNGYSIEDVMVDDNSVGAQSDYRFENVSSSHTIEAIFTPLSGIPPTPADHGFVIYPNPADDKITISSAYGQFHAEVYTTGGRLIKSFRSIEGDGIIPTSPCCEEGIYIIKLVAGDKTEFKKLIILK